ncbi:MAG: SpoIVB peptidase [Clostridiaceae bacterium]|nr:SpoIVB peptidase [Clostridiaceae bacterium]
MERDFFVRRILKPSFLISLLILVFIVAYTVTLFILPNNITLITGEDYNLSFISPLFLQAYSNSNILLLKDSSKKAMNAFENPYNLKATNEGEAQISLRMFGIIPVKTVQVKSIVNQKVLASGSPIGIKLKTNGIVIINISSVILENGSKISPAETAGLLTGDVILKANGKELNNIRELLDIVETSEGKPIEIVYKRQNTQHITTITPIKSGEDDKYRLGIWVRDSSAGIGTLTFVDPINHVYGALGHGINDIDTGSLLQVGSGELLESNIQGIKKGLKGSPGELEGDFMSKSRVIGDIKLNCDFGVFGNFNDTNTKKWGRSMQIGSHSMVHEGPATILTCIDNTEVKEYKIEIQKISRLDLNSTKNMVICITDERLLKATGGIVQGMSGSPIIQDGRLIGAVTHVFINDPTRGYGVFIESMIAKSNSIAKK